MKKFRVGIIGCGNIFPMHAYPVAHGERTELVAVCDVKEDRLREKAEAFGCRGYTDYREMLEKESLDVVHLCTPHHLHAPMAIRAMEMGCHVLTEKPMAIRLEDAEAMVETARRTGKTLGVIFQNRYNPGSVLIKETLESGALGKVRTARAMVTWDRSDEYYSKSDWKGTWEMEGGGVLIDQAIHTMDLMRWFIDAPITKIFANLSNRAHDRIEVEDVAEGVLHFENGAVAGFYAINYYGYDAPVEIELVCEKGIAKLVADNATVDFGDGRKLEAGPNPHESFSYGNVKSYWGVSHVKQIGEFYDALEQGRKPAVDGGEALKTQRMICGIYDQR
ncbi:Gfo/Idh/MocA family protein [Anaerotalea alkaliphila]|uniref:Gfo/Idh/MocA family oxidoreductase n=1 Tax=Anaerotalea alkaliphila TaxID=2662126 RepID=A0A7X5HVH3_9FIRM|nr:Gfo/Idh/MocA family oxidoreductase [Anaerotalea alkaliphila]NDL67395.1 Gfo/Idh/MocA family oxidoreductase [Anaerotalea alkaliphila]